MFGYEKGAFTGAVAKKKGKFDLANEGTIFLDEIADMSLKTQAKVLRILEEQKFERVGGTRTIEVDVRIIAATNKDLEAEMKTGAFREDLFYRLNVIPLNVPALRERRQDIALLASHFLNEYSKENIKIKKEISEEAMKSMINYDWPGNVRELRNIIERLVIMTPKRVISKGDLPKEIKDAGGGDQGRGVFDVNNLKDAKMQFEKEFITRKLIENNYNVSKTADDIGVERTNVYIKIKSYKIKVS